MALSPEADNGPREAVEVEGLVKRFGAFTAVDRISFSVTRGEIFGFLGPNGAGKSTTIRILCGLLLPTEGRGRVYGFDLYTESEQIKQHLGYMSQRFSLYEELTVRENLNFYGGLYGLNERAKRERNRWAMTMADLADLADAPVRSLSGGWKQRLALGCALLHEPPLLFLDEPTAGVDPISRRRFWDLIYDLAGRGVTVFVTTHYLDEAEYCDRLALINNGRIIAMGTPTDLKMRHMTRSVLEVECEPLIPAMERLAPSGLAEEVAIFGNTLHLVVRDAGGTMARLSPFLAGHNISVRRMETITPSLEDVFVSLIRAQGSQDAGAAGATGADHGES
ncbi:MAG TPA: ABC transporter ATP-binding protein [Nitrospiria bacterium]|nr:ABC transporter ATP-binding protein [Nitrospiria bacterium]